MKVVVKPPQGETVDFDVDPTDPLITLKCLIESAKPEVGQAETLQLTYKGTLLADDNASLVDIQYQEGDVMLLSGPASSVSATSGLTSTVTKVGAASGITGAQRGPDRPGSAPSSGFEAVTMVVSSCGNEKSNGVYSPAKPYDGKAVWYKAPAEADVDDAEGDEAKSKDKGERYVYFSSRTEKWFIGDALEEGGFTYVQSPGKCCMPPSQGWNNGATITFESSSLADGQLNAPVALSELAKLQKIEPWADQEVCYVTMLKVLGNMVSNPSEAKFFSLKVDNQAIQNKILRFDGARGFLEAIGFRETSGVLSLPLERCDQAKHARDLLEGFANDAQYQNIRKERHAKAAVEAKKEADLEKMRPKKQALQDYGDGPRGGGGSRGGPQRGGG
eukprot:TRINITY_DN11472_c0_g3_i1.p1 TRINITY_DN11472_c0_g3~~TRINITY_DN11472_c0_g3_i1.p1  ORF type:complete len:389 (+),score=68.76 TRINITY_DN11472_c0_g3_i1:63-1229(+)